MNIKFRYIRNYLNLLGGGDDDDDNNVTAVNDYTGVFERNQYASFSENNDIDFLWIIDPNQNYDFTNKLFFYEILINRKIDILPLIPTNINFINYIVDFFGFKIKEAAYYLFYFLYYDFYIFCSLYKKIISYNNTWWGDNYDISQIKIDYYNVLNCDYVKFLKFLENNPKTDN